MFSYCTPSCLAAIFNRLSAVHKGTFEMIAEASRCTIRFIKHAQSIRFTLNEIAELLSLKVEPEATCGDIPQRIDAKLADVERKIKILHGMKKTLMKLKRACKTPSAPSKECPILESLDTAEKQASGDAHSNQK